MIKKLEAFLADSIWQIQKFKKIIKNTVLILYAYAMHF